MCPWDMDAPALTYRQTGSRWMADRSVKHLHGTTHHAEALLPNIKSFCPVEVVKSLTNIFWTDGRMYRRTLVKPNTPTAFYLSFRSIKFS